VNVRVAPLLPVALAFAFAALCACGAGASEQSSASPSSHVASSPRRLDPSIPGFLPANRARIDRMLAERGNGSASFDPAHPPVATFDWDNTVMRNDIGDATMSWMLLHDAILQPPNRDWSVTSEDLTPAALSALHAACDAAAEPGKPLPTSTTPSCADEIFSIYDAGKTNAGAPAWSHETTLTTKQPYAWEARLLAGHTPDEIRGFAREAYKTDGSAPLHTTRTIGTHKDVTAWVHVYEPMRDLIGALQKNGFDVWVVSASPQYVTEIVAHEVGIAPDHVVGVRTVRAAGNADERLGYDLESCGGAPKNAVMTFDQGKRCWINKAIFRLPEASQLARADAAHRPAFSAGDSDTDVAFVQDATELKLVIDRHKVALMCNAFANRADRWLVQPMFIDPLPLRKEPYPCSTAVDAAGAPLVDETGARMPDQTPRPNGPHE
jgi:hypothetical protein